MRDYSENNWSDLLLTAYEEWFWRHYGWDPYENCEENYGDCPYYLRYEGVAGYEKATCSHGCWDEPRCITCEPRDGWAAHPPMPVIGVLPNHLTDEGNAIYDGQRGAQPA